MQLSALLPPQPPLGSAVTAAAGRGKQRAASGRAASTSSSNAAVAAAPAAAAASMAPCCRASGPLYAILQQQSKQRVAFLSPLRAVPSSAEGSGAGASTTATTTSTSTAAQAPPPAPVSSSSSAGWWAAPPTFVAFAAQQRGETAAAAAAAAAAASAASAAAAPLAPPPPPTPPPPPSTPPSTPTSASSPLLVAAATGPRPRVAYQGLPGAYSEAAALAAFPGCDPLPCRTFEGAFQAAAQWSADAAVVPIENSLGGSIHAVYDLLLRYGDGLRIVGEVGVAVSHCLLAPKGTKLEDLTEVTSHPQALAQCEGFVRSLASSNSASSSGENKRKIARVAAEDTAGAAAELSARWAAATAAASEGADDDRETKKKNTTAAIASARAADLYDLDVLASDIQDAEASSNVTRFLVLVREPAAPRPSPGDPRRHKASVVFSLPDGPGALFRALSVFALRDISMTKVESRPARDAPLLLEEGEETEEEGEEEEEEEDSEGAFSSSSSSFDEQEGSSKKSSSRRSRRRRRRRFNYLFYLDVQANTADPLAQNALRHLREIAPFMRVLGCYPEMSGEPVGLPGVAEGAGGLRGGAMRGASSSSSSSSSSVPPPPSSVPSASSSTTLRVAYQGAPGAYSEGAALAAVPGCDLQPCEQFGDAFEALSSGRADRAVLPIENSLGGSIHAVYDLLLRHRLHVVGEASVGVDHCLMALPGTKVADVKRVSSHWQALAQVAGYLRGLNNGTVEPVVADDTAGAARALSLSSNSSSSPGAEAAVASARAAELYGLEVLARSIQDNPANVTRFLVLAREPALLPSSASKSSKRDEKNKKEKNKKKGNAFRASVAVALPDGPGALFKVLSVFALRDIDLTKIESRPLPPSVLEEMQRGGLVGTVGVGVGIGVGVGGGVSAGGLQNDASSSSSPPSSAPPPLRGGPFGYVFYVDVAANLADEAPQNALRHLQEIAPFMRVLGCYPVADAAE